jgi:hypothetical protein
VEFGNPSITSGSDTKQVVKRLVEAYQNSEYALATVSKIKQITSNIVIYLINFLRSLLVGCMSHHAMVSGLKTLLSCELHSWA